MLTKTKTVVLVITALFSFLVLEGMGRAQIEAPPGGSQKDTQERIKKVIGRSWSAIEPCIDIYATNHPDDEFFIIRFEVEPGNKIGGVYTQPSDDEASECFKSALGVMEFPAVYEEVPFQFRIDLPEKIEPEEDPEPPAAANEEEEPEETQVSKPPPPLYVPVGQGKLYTIDGKVVGAYKLKSFLIDQPASARLARKSRGHMFGGWFLRVSGALMGITGAVLLSFGINEYINSDVPGHPKDWAAAFTATGVVMFVGGIVFEIVGGVLIPRSWPYLSEAVKTHNAADPDVPVYPAGY